MFTFKLVNHISGTSLETEKSKICDKYEVSPSAKPVSVVAPSSNNLNSNPITPAKDLLSRPKPDIWDMQISPRLPFESQPCSLLATSDAKQNVYQQANSLDSVQRNRDIENAPSRHSSTNTSTSPLPSSANVSEAMAFKTAKYENC